MSNLIIVESPTKAKTLSKFLGSDYRIEATMGHIRDLPEKKLGIEIRIKKEKYDFIPQYQIIPSRKQRVTELKKLAEGSSSVILATDPDREGEAIAWHIYELLKLENGNEKLDKEVRNKKLEKNPTSNIQHQNLTSNFHKPTSTQRIVFHEITESAIKHALGNPRSIDIQLVDAQQARRILDRLVGYKLSPLLWNKIGLRFLSAGRVQSVAVRLIVEREREIENFTPVEYWLIDVELTRQLAGHPERSEGSLANASSNKSRDSSPAKRDQNDKVSFLARLEKINDKKADLGNKEQGDKAVEDLKVAKYKVSNVEIKDARRYPSPPFTTSTLQQTASNRFGWSAKRVMRTAQNLYEEGLITYHRTDSTNLSAEAINMVRDYINNVYGKDYLPATPKFYKTKSKVAQEAHEAIRPTAVGEISNREPSGRFQISNKIGRDASLLYELIWKRFVACQMNEAVFEQTTVEIEASVQMSLRTSVKQSVEIATSPSAPRNDNNKYFLKASGEKMKFAGWLTLYLKGNGINGNDEKVDNSANKELPKLAAGEDLNFLNIFPQQKFTEPPGRYTEATLIKALEEKGIGRPSTYAPIISTIQD
ncbi:type I DNA topoisomerase, partial [Candidatus Gottesmanbacteria bacterium]|nr:type I DNA topoisomerase [Candidatus Gottesmanbacteria bacterium]